MSTITLYAIECDRCHRPSEGKDTANLAREWAEKNHWKLGVLYASARYDICRTCFPSWEWTH
jgi:hypothetical protein